MKISSPSKNILITGENSYIGTSLASWLNKNSSIYNSDFISLKNDNWKDESFVKYDTIVHTAGIVHKGKRKVDDSQYYLINHDLTLEIAKKAKKEGVKQFIFLSTMNVYGKEKGIINKSSIPKPKSPYGKSKLLAEEALKKIGDKNLKIAILRPPMVYGENCKGNYKKLSKIIKFLFVFPNISNQRSMIYIYNLTECIKIIIDKEDDGLFFPQNREYVSTKDLINGIKTVRGEKVFFTRLFNPIIKQIDNDFLNKIFGNLTYDHDLSSYPSEYNIYDFETSMYNTERS